MKKYIFILGFALLPLITIGQNSKEIFNKFKGTDDVTTVSISKYMFSMFSDVEAEDPDSKEFLDLVKTLDGMKILTTDNKEKGKNINDEVNSYLNKNDFKELMTVEEKGKDVRFMIKEKGDKVSELIMLVYESQGEVVFMSITGDIDLASISKLSKKMNIDGMENLDEIDNKK